MTYEGRNPLNAELPLDVAERLRYTMGDTGDLQEAMGGFRIAVHHSRAFPWADVFKLLLNHDFRIYVTRRKADIRIEANV